MHSSDEDEVPVVEFDDGDDYFSGQPLSPTTLKSTQAPKTLKPRRRKRDKSVSSSKTPILAPKTPVPADTSSKAVPPIFQLLGSITGRATDFYNSWTRPAAAAASQPPRRGSGATNTSYMTAPPFAQSPLMKDMMMPPEFQPLPSLLNVPVNAPPTPPGEEYLKPKPATTTQQQPQTQTQAGSTSKKIALPSVGHVRQQLLNQANHYSNTFLSSPLLLAGAAVVVGLAITVGRPLLEIYIHKGIHYLFNFIFYATVTAAVATAAAVAWLVVSAKMKKTDMPATPVRAQSSPVDAPSATPAVSLADTTPPLPDLSRRSSKRRSRRSSAATTNASVPPSMMYPPYGYPPQQWDEYNYPGHPPPPPMNMYMPPSPMYQPQLYHPVPVRPFEPPQTQNTPAAPPTPTTSAFPLPPTPGHARTESGNVAAIPEILQQQPKKKQVYRVVQRKVERDIPREVRPPLRTRELPPVPREPPQVPKHQGLPAVFTRFEDENSMVNYASPPTEVDLKVGDHSFKPYGSPPRRFHGMNV